MRGKSSTAAIKAQAHADQCLTIVMATLERRHEKLMAHLREMVFIADPAGTLLYLNPAWQQCLGYPCVDSLGKSLFSYVADDAQGAVRAMLAHKQQAHEAGVEIRLVHANGADAWAELSILDIPDQGVVMGLLVDVTQKKRAEIVLAASDENLKQILAHSPEGVLALTATNQISFCNRRLSDMLELNIGTDGKIPLLEFLERLGERVELAKAGGLQQSLFTGAREGVFDLKAPERVIKWEAKDLDSASLRHIIFFRDITKEAEVDRMKSEFLATAAHELRTPMASIYGFVELMLTREMPDKDRKEYLGIVHEQAKSLINMLNELLDLARIEARSGKDFNFTAQDAWAIAMKALAELRGQFDAREVVAIPPPGLLPEVRIDAEKIKQVFTNVIGNAYKYSPNGANIVLDNTIREDESGAWLGIRVRDHGIGMTKEQVSRVFERFYRANASGHIPGTGLGMSLVREIMEIHGGKVEISSTLGKGTDVTLWFPLTGEPTQEVRNV